MVSDITAAPSSIKVAIKSPRDGRNINHQKTLADELKVMIAIGIHPNVLPLVGAVTKQMSRYFLLFYLLFIALPLFFIFLSIFSLEKIFL